MICDSTWVIYIYNVKKRGVNGTHCDCKGFILCVCAKVCACTAVSESDKNATVGSKMYSGIDSENKISIIHFGCKQFLSCSRMSRLLKQVRLELWFDGESGLCDVEYME